MLLPLAVQLLQVRLIQSEEQLNLVMLEIQSIHHHKVVPITQMWESVLTITQLAPRLNPISRSHSQIPLLRQHTVQLILPSQIAHLNHLVVIRHKILQVQDMDLLLLNLLLTTLVLMEIMLLHQQLLLGLVQQVVLLANSILLQDKLHHTHQLHNHHILTHHHNQEAQHLLYQQPHLHNRIIPKILRTILQLAGVIHLMHINKVTLQPNILPRLTLMLVHQHLEPHHQVLLNHTQVMGSNLLHNSKVIFTRHVCNNPLTFR